MSDRDDLADILREHAMPVREPDFPRDEFECCADAVIEKGWRPPPRAVEGHDDLLNLPSGSVLLHTPCPQLTHACLWTKGAFQWFTVGTTELYDCCDVMGHLDPGEQLLVISTPEAGDQS